MSPSRREFLRNSLGTSAVFSFGSLPALLGRTTQAGNTRSGDPGDTVLVALELSGGNDGMNTLVPYADDEYYRKRPTIGVPAGKLHKIDDRFGFHPRMTGFKRLYDEGLLGVVHGVGYPDPSGDHQVSLRNWQTARPHESHCQTGWLGRVADRMEAPYRADVAAVFVGKTRQPFTLNAERAIVPNVRSLERWKLPVDSAPSPQRVVPDSDNPLVAFLHESMASARAAGRRVEEVVRAEAARPASPYPDFQLAQTLRMVARLIRADLGIRVFGTELGGDGFGGFDNHANQIGNHCALLEQLSESVAAFADDLKRDGLIERVVLYTYSEFGRTVAENGRRGTDHGSAAPVFLVGGRLEGGLAGVPPNLTELEAGGQKHHVDFRRVYAALLDDWLGFDSEPLLGERFEPWKLFRA